MANMYFTLVAGLSLTSFSPVSPYTTFTPLVLVIGISMAKEASEDLKRYKLDKEINARPVLVLREGSFVEIPWRDVKVRPGWVVAKRPGIHQLLPFSGDLPFLFTPPPPPLALPPLLGRRCGEGPQRPIFPRRHAAPVEQHARRGLLHRDDEPGRGDQLEGLCVCVLCQGSRRKAKSAGRGQQQR